MRKAIVLLALAGLAAEAQEIPRRATEYALHMPGGSQTLLSAHRGKVILLSFLFTTCPHCQRSAQIMNQLQKEYGPKGFQALAGAFNDGAEGLVAQFARQYGLSFPVGATDRMAVYQYLQKSMMQPGYVPLLVFIDRNSMIRAQYAGDHAFFQDEEKNMRQMIESLLKGPGPATKKSTSAKKTAQ